jgi:hypothetical protein
LASRGIADVNLERRDLKKGQKAMALAMLYPDPEKGGRGKKSVATRHGFSKDRLSDARSVLAHSLALAQDVIADRVPLDAALARALCEAVSGPGKRRTRQQKCYDW